MPPHIHTLQVIDTIDHSFHFLLHCIWTFCIETFRRCNDFLHVSLTTSSWTKIFSLVVTCAIETFFFILWANIPILNWKLQLTFTHLKSANIYPQAYHALLICVSWTWHADIRYAWQTTYVHGLAFRRFHSPLMSLIWLFANKPETTQTSNEQ